MYGLLYRSSELFHRTGSACEYLAAGLLLRRDLRAAMGMQFRGFASSADEIDEGLNPFEMRVYCRWLPPSGRILLVGSGAGRDLLGLARLGYQVTGVEPLSDLVETARSHLARCRVSASVTLGSIETVDLDSQYDAVIFAPACYSNIQSSSVRVGTLSRLRSHLSPGGRLIISYIGSVSRSRVAVALMRISTRLAAADWKPEPGDAFARYHESHGNLYFEHVFRRGEIAQECAAAGFRVADEYFNSNRADCIVLEPA